MVNPSDANGIVTITQVKPIDAVFSVPEAHVGTLARRLAEGRELPVELWDRDLKQQLGRGRLNAVDNSIDIATGTIKAKAAFDNAEGRLFANQFVNVRLEVDRLEQALTVPTTAVQNNYVYLVQEDGTVTQRRIAVGVTTWPARVMSPGEVSSMGQGGIRFMPCDGQRSAVFDLLADDLNRAGMHCSIDPQVQEAIWEKLAFNAAFNGVCAVTRQTVDGLANPQGEALLQRVLDEVLSVAHAHGVAASAERVGAAVRDALDHHRGHQPSMLQDLLAGRATETGAIHGAVLKVADRLGIAVPVTRTLHALVSLSENAGAVAPR